VSRGFEEGDMKSTEIARRDREFNREKKRKEVLDRRNGKKAITVGDYIEKLASLFYHDGKKIFNIASNNDTVLDLLETMKLELPEKQWDNVIRKAVRKTAIVERETAVNELKGIVEAL
jgi:hypothetical protein